MKVLCEGRRQGCGQQLNIANATARYDNDVVHYIHCQFGLRIFPWTVPRACSWRFPWAFSTRARCIPSLLQHLSKGSQVSYEQYLEQVDARATVLQLSSIGYNRKSSMSCNRRHRKPEKKNVCRTTLFGATPPNNLGNNDYHCTVCVNVRHGAQQNQPRPIASISFWNTSPLRCLSTICAR